MANKQTQGGKAVASGTPPSPDFPSGALIHAWDISGDVYVSLGDGNALSGRDDKSGGKAGNSRPSNRAALEPYDKHARRNEVARERANASTPEVAGPAEFNISAGLRKVRNLVVLDPDMWAKSSVSRTPDTWPFQTFSRLAGLVVQLPNVEKITLKTFTNPQLLAEVMYATQGRSVQLGIEFGEPSGANLQSDGFRALRELLGQSPPHPPQRISDRQLLCIIYFLFWCDRSVPGSMINSANFWGATPYGGAGYVLFSAATGGASAIASLTLSAGLAALVGAGMRAVNPQAATLHSRIGQGMRRIWAPIATKLSYGMWSTLKINEHYLSEILNEQSIHALEAEESRDAYARILEFANERFELGDVSLFGDADAPEGGRVGGGPASPAARPSDPDSDDDTPILKLGGASAAPNEQAVSAGNAGAPQGGGAQPGGVATDEPDLANTPADEPAPMEGLQSTVAASSPAATPADEPAPTDADWDFTI